MDGARCDAVGDAPHRQRGRPSSSSRSSATATNLARAGAARLRSAGSIARPRAVADRPVERDMERPGQRRDEVAGSDDAGQRGEAEQDRQPDGVQRVVQRHAAVEADRARGRGRLRTGVRHRARARTRRSASSRCRAGSPRRSRRSAGPVASTANASRRAVRLQGMVTAVMAVVSSFLTVLGRR